MSFSFLDLVLFAGVIQGVFLIFSLQFISNKNKVANKILTIIVGLATFIFAGKMGILQIKGNWVWRFSLLTDCSIYMFGPLLYTYFRTLVYKERPTDVLTWKHFIPSLLLFLFFLWTLTVSTEAYFKMSYSIGMFFAYLAMELTGVISLILYSVASYKIVKQIKNTDEQTSVYKHKIAQYIQYILIGITMIVVFWVFGIIKTYFIHSFDSYISYNLVWISIATFLFIVGYCSFTQPEIVRLTVEKTTIKDRLRQEEIKTISEKLAHLIDEEQIFMQSDLNLKKLAKKLDTSSNNLSWLLNSVYGKTFYEFINKYRVKAFLAKIEEGEHKKQTLLAIAMDVGFNSKSTFNKSFKSIMNETPSRYIDKMHS